MKIYIKEQEVELKQTFRSYIVYEQMTEKLFQPKTMTDFSIYFYSVILTSKQDLELTFDDFILWLDDNMDKYKDFMEWLSTQGKINEDTTKKPKTKKKI